MNKGVTVNKETIEKLQADFLGDEFKTVQPYPIYRINKGDMRIYVKVFDDNTFMYGAGVTSILKKTMPESFFLNEWKVTKTAQYGAEYTNWYLENSANYGTFYHVLCGRLLKAEKINLEKESFFDYMELFYNKNGYDFYDGMKWYKHAKKNYKKDILSFVQWVQDYKVRPIAVEYQFVTKLNISNNISEERFVYYAGTFDLICRIDIDGKDTIALVDFKTSKQFYPSHEAQLIMYARAWNNEGIHEVVEGLVVEKAFNFAPKNWRNKPSYLFKDQTKSKERCNISHYLDVFNNVSPIDLKDLISSEINDCDISIDSNIEDIIFEKDQIKEILEGINGSKNKE